nr:flippase [Photobacterium damselae]
MIFVIVDNFFILFVSLILSIYSYRILGPAKMGVLNTALGFWGLFGFILAIANDSIIIRFLTKYKRVNYSIVTLSFIVKFIFGCFSVVVTNIIASYYTDNNTLLYCIFFASLSGLCNCLTVFDYYFQSISEANIGSKCRMKAKLLSAILHIYLLITTTNIYLYSLVLVFYNFMVGIFYFFYYIKIDGMIKYENTKNKKFITILIKRSLPLLLSAIAIPIFMQSDTVMINYFLGEDEAGLYSAVTKLLMPLNMIPIAIMTVYFPILIRSKSRNIIFIRLHSIFIYIGVIVACCVSMFSSEIMVIIYGQEYSSVSNILSIQIWSLVVALIGPIGTKWLIIHGVQKVEFYKTIIAALFNVIGNCLLIPTYGLLGASISSLLAYLIANVLIFICIKKTRQLSKIQYKSLNIISVLNLGKV